jgi:hypothetical protein
VNLTGGMVAWEQAGQPVVRAAGADDAQGEPRHEH